MATNPNPETVEERLATVAESLGIPQNTVQITQVRLNRLESEPNVDDAALEGIAAAALALSSREDGLPITDTEILEAWRAVVGDDSNATPDPQVFDERVESVAGALDLDETPPQPTDLLWTYGAELTLDEELVAAATRLFRDLFEEEPGVVANGTKPESTVAAVLSLTADMNEIEAATLRELGDVSGAGEVTVRNRYRDVSEAYERSDLSPDAYAVEGDGTPIQAAQPADAPAADGNGDGGEAEAGATAVPGVDAGADDAEAGAGDAEAGGAGAGGAEASDASAGTGGADAGAQAPGDGAAEASGDAVDDGPAPTVAEVEAEIDALADELSIDPSVRLFARGMISDAVSDVGSLDASELAAAALVAGARREDEDVGAADVAEVRAFTAREISRALDRLDAAIDVDIPRRSPVDVAEDLIDDLDLSGSVREEAERVLESYERDEDDEATYTAGELGAGAVFFAATVTATDVDVEDVAGAAGAGVEYVTDAMNEILIAQCLGLVRGEVSYEECTWTEELLESDLAPTVGDSAEGRAVGVAKAYVAGREGEAIDEATLEALLGGE